MRRHRVLAQQFAQVPRRTLCHASRIDEHQGRTMLLNQLRQPHIDLAPDVAGHHRSERRLRQLDRQIAFARIADIDDFAIRRAALGH